VVKNWRPSRSNSPIVEKAEQRLRQGVRWGENMPIHLRTGTSAAEHNLRKSWPFAPKPRAFRRLHEVFADHSCRECSQKSRCTRGKYRTIAIHTCEPARQRAHARAQTPAFAISQRARRKVEALFAELKNYIGLRRLRLRRMRFVREQFYLAATAQNLKRLVRFLSGKSTPQIATA